MDNRLPQDIEYNNGIAAIDTRTPRGVRLHDCPSPVFNDPYIQNYRRREFHLGVRQEGMHKPEQLPLLRRGGGKFVRLLWFTVPRIEGERSQAAVRDKAAKLDVPGYYLRSQYRHIVGETVRQFAGVINIRGKAFVAGWLE